MGSIITPDMMEDDELLSPFNPSISISNDYMSYDEEKMMDNIARSNNSKLTDDYVTEFLKCRASPLYFINNYIYLDEIGGTQLYTSEMTNKKFRRVAKSLHRYHKCILMASRQLGKLICLTKMIYN